MFESLAGVVDGLEIPVHREAIAEVLAVRDRLEAKVLTAVAAYEAGGGHEVDGAVTMAGWLRQHGRMEATASSRMAVRSRKLAALPALSAAFADGRLSGGQVDVVLAHVKLRHLERFATHEAAVIPSLVPLTVDQTVRVMSDWRARAEALDDAKPPAEHDNELFLSKTIEGRGELRGSLDSDLHAVVDAALRVADSRDQELTPAERRAEALGQVCHHFLDHQRTRPGGRHRPHLNVTLTYEQFCQQTIGRYQDTGALVSPAQLGVLCCDSAVHRLVHDGASGILDYGRATRNWPVDLYNAIVARDGGCRWPGCTAPASWCDVHHAVAWEDGGPTSVDNGFLACRRHHRRGHEPGWHTKLLPDGTVEITHPDGRVESTRPPGPITEPLWPPGRC